jgi:hypothetical protein
MASMRTGRERRSGLAVQHVGAFDSVDQVKYLNLDDPLGEIEQQGIEVVGW